MLKYFAQKIIRIRQTLDDSRINYLSILSQMEHEYVQAPPFISEFWADLRNENITSFTSYGACQLIRTIPYIILFSTTFQNYKNVLWSTVG